MFCAPSRMFETSLSISLTAARAVKGGQRTISASSNRPISWSKSATSTRASAWVLFIFQLPAMIFLRLIIKIFAASGRLELPFHPDFFKLFLGNFHRHEFRIAAGQLGQIGQ